MKSEALDCCENKQGITAWASGIGLEQICTACVWGKAKPSSLCGCFSRFLFFLSVLIIGTVFGGGLEVAISEGRLVYQHVKNCFNTDWAECAV